MCDEIKWAFYGSDELYVCFITGETLVFKGVEEDVWNEYADAENKVAFLNQRMIGHYEFTKQAAIR